MTSILGTARADKPRLLRQLKVKRLCAAVGATADFDPGCVKPSKQLPSRNKRIELATLANPILL
jgi:hypothetical protein